MSKTTTLTTILQVIPTLNTGGAELSTIEITAALTQAGARALVLTEGGRLEKDIIEAGGEIIRHPVATKNPFKIYRNASFIEKLIKTENINLVHARSRAPAWSAWMAARRTSTPFVTTYHGAYGNKEPFKNQYNRIMASGDITIANSEYTANLVREQHSPEESKLRVIHRGVDTDLFKRSNISEDRKSALMKQWEIQPGQKIILQTARLTGWKGQSVLIKAIAILKNKNPELLNDHVVILAGDDQGRNDYKQRLIALIKENNLTDIVRLPGHCADIAAALSISHLSVVASTAPEAFGRAAIEAQAMECPVIVTNIGAAVETVLSTPDVLEKQTTGWRIPPDNPEKLAEAIEYALQMDGRNRENLIARARHHVATNFSLELMRKKTLVIYDELIGSKLSQPLEK